MKTLLTSAAIALLLTVTACTKEYSTSEARADVSKVKAEAAKDVAKAQNKADATMASATEDVNEAQRDAAQAFAGATRDVKVAEADAANKVASERCQSQTGQARTTCKNVADTEYAAAKARADAAEAVASQ